MLDVLFIKIKNNWHCIVYQMNTPGFTWNLFSNTKETVRVPGNVYLKVSRITPGQDLVLKIFVWSTFTSWKDHFELTRFIHWTAVGSINMLRLIYSLTEMITSLQFVKWSFTTPIIPLTRRPITIWKTNCMNFNRKQGREKIFSWRWLLPTE